MIDEKMIEAAEVELSRVLKDFDYCMPADGMARVLKAALESAKQKEGGSDRLADLVEGMIKESPYDRWPQSRMALAIAANAVRRGRHLTSEEKMRNLVDAMEEDGPLPDHVRAGLLHDR